MRIHNAEQFKEALGEVSNDNLFLFIGRIHDWDGDVPTTIDSIREMDYRVWDNMLALKRITENDVYLVIPRYDWAEDTLYNSYDSDSNTLFTNSTPFYVRTTDRNIYKCLFANNGGSNSFVQPTGTSTEAFATNDGYVWKFMYSVTSAIELKFLTDEYLPVQRPANNDSSAQWLVQQAAVDGSIDIVKIANSGSNYITTTGNFSVVSSATSMTLDASASITPGDYVDYGIFLTTGTGAGQIGVISAYDASTKTITLAGDGFTTLPDTGTQYLISPRVKVEGSGINFSAYSTVDTNGTDIDSIVIVSPGSGYSQANVYISGTPGSGAILRPMLSPSGGHGFNAIDELGGHNVLIHTSLSGNESGTISANNDFRYYGIVKNPLGSANGQLATGDVFNQTVRLSLVNVTNNGLFILDEQVTSSADGTTSYQVVEFANTNAANTEGVLSISNANGTPITVGSEIATNTSNITAVINSIQLGDLEPYSGKVLFLENRDTITRDAMQKEDFRITLKF